MHLWTDSTDILHWLQSHPSCWRAFIANRRVTIHDNVPRASWHHIRTCDNPADVFSRGSTPKDLLKKYLWWYGPSWLKDEKSPWTTAKDVPLESIDTHLEEDSKSIKSHSTTLLKYIWDLIHRFSSANKIIRITAYCLRFIFEILKAVLVKRQITKKAFFSSSFCIRTFIFSS